MPALRTVTPVALEDAFAWVSQRRIAWHHNTDIWDLRAKWLREKPALLTSLAAGTYRLSPLSRVTKHNGDVLELWSARDALVLKVLTERLGAVLPSSPRCTHLRGHGGLKGAVAAVEAALTGFAYVLRTDVKSYYASIDHDIVLTRLAGFISDPRLVDLVSQYLRRTVEYGGTFQTIERGISLGCPLSPLMGAFVLYDLDRAMEKAMAKGDLFYIRYMDDILVLTRTHWGLRRAVRCVNRHLQALNLSQHPDKTLIGKIARGFDFLGYHFSRAEESGQRLSLAAITRAKFKEKLFRLYEQVQRGKTRQRFGPQHGTEHLSPLPDRLTRYAMRWLAFARGGLSNVPSYHPSPDIAFVHRCLGRLGGMGVCRTG